MSRHVKLVLLTAVMLLGTSAAAVAATAGPSAPAAGNSVQASAPAGAGASGAAGEGETLNVRLRTQDRTPVPGVTVTVTSGGTEIATVETDDQGVAVVTVPTPGPYTVEVDVTTLPAEFTGLALDQNPRDTQVDPGTARNLNLVLKEAGSAPAGASSPWSTLPQLLVSGLRFGLLLALAALGLSMIFGTTGLTNFAHGEFITIGAFLTLWFNNTFQWPFVLAAVLAIALTAAYGWANDAGLWKPLRVRGTGLIPMMIVSIGLSIFVRYIVLIRNGGETFQYREYAIQPGWNFGLVSLKPADAIGMLIAVVVLILAALALIFTRIGKATRAVSDNPALAAASGIDVDRVIRIVWTVGAGMAGLSGVLFGLSQGVKWELGFQLLLLIFAAVTLGGLGTAFGAVIGALIVGVLIDVSTARLPIGPVTLGIPTELKYVGALFVLIVILLVRPQGILGRRERVG